MNYTELQTNITDWLNRSDLSAITPTFIALAEARLNRQLRTTNQYQRADVSTPDQYLTMPGDFLEMKTLRVISPVERELVEIAAHQINEYSSTDAVASYSDGYPRFYVYGNALRVIPTPSEAITYEMFYYGRIPPLSAQNPTNWLLDAHPDAYLYYSLLQAAPYLGEDERLGVWQSQADRAVAEIQASDDRRRVRGSRHKLNFQAFS